jgi:hypothetical protein
MNVLQYQFVNAHRRYHYAQVLFSAVLLFILSYEFAGAQEGNGGLTMNEVTQRDVMRRIIEEAFIPGNFDALDAFLSADYVVHTPLGDMDNTGTKRFLGAIWGALSDFNAVQDPVIVDGDFVSARTVLTGTFSRPFYSPMGVFEPTGARVAFESINIVEE